MEPRGAEHPDDGAPAADAEGACALVESARVTGLEGVRIGRAPTGLSARMREQLGLPLDRPVIMSGHQAELWHPGILAKWIAGVEIARRVGGVFAWLHVDQDTNEPGAIDVPVIDGSGVLVKRTLTLVDPSRDVPTGSRPAARIDRARAAPARGESLVDSAAVERIVADLNAHAAEPTLALQFGRTIEAIAARVAGGGGDGVRSITTTDLAATDAFATLVDLLRRDPVRAVEAHNRAVAEVPEAEMRALGLKRGAADGRSEQPARVELPLWRVGPGAVRTPVMLSQVASIPLAELRPRALLMTGLARLGACDVFIHGIGGGVYDRITDRWLETWLGGDAGANTDLRGSLPLAPVIVATATARLDFGSDRGGVSVEAARAAQHAAHRARHDPALVGDPEGAAFKRSLVERIAATQDRGTRLALYREMHAALERVREASAAEIEKFQREAADRARRAAEIGVVVERTWALSLYPQETLAKVAEAVREAVRKEMGP